MKIKALSLVISIASTLGLLALYACSDSQEISRIVIHEIYQVDGDEVTKKPTVLSYKDVKHYDAHDNLVQQNFYQVDNSLKGYEFIKRTGDQGVTNYYDADSNLLAIYELEYEGNNITKRTAYDGNTKEALRVESYEYSINDKVDTKKIFSADGTLMDLFRMKYDNDGNEIQYLRYSGKERWGYKNEVPTSFHRRTFSD